MKTYDPIGCSYLTLNNGEVVEFEYLPVRDLTVVLPLFRAYVQRPGNDAGGRFHVIQDDGNAEQVFAALTWRDLTSDSTIEEMHLCRLLCGMSTTQRRKLARLVWVNYDNEERK